MGPLAKFLLALSNLVRSGIIRNIPTALKAAEREFGRVTPLLKKQIERIFELAKKPKVGEQYRFHFDATACVGCHCCEVACNEQNNNPSDVKWRRVGETQSGIFPNVTNHFNSMSCNHCIDPECLKGCPTESYIKFDNGIKLKEEFVIVGDSRLAGTRRSSA